MYLSTEQQAGAAMISGMRKLQGGLLHKKDIRSFYLEMLSMIAM